MLIPEAWADREDISDAVRSLYNYCNCVMEPWDGPAAIAATDGRWVIAGMDRNGLRPMRFSETKDGLLFVGSESGMVPIAVVAALGKDRQRQRVALMSRMGLAAHPDQLVTKQALTTIGKGRHFHQGQVQLALGHQCCQVMGAVIADHFQTGLRVAQHEALQQRDKAAGGVLVMGTEAHLAAHIGMLEAAENTVMQVEQLLGTRLQLLPGRSQPDPVLTALQQFGRHQGFQPRELHADGRGRAMQALGRSGQVQGLGDHDKGA
jgi:hypothetical protein